MLKNIMDFKKLLDARISALLESSKQTMSLLASKDLAPFEKLQLKEKFDANQLAIKEAQKEQASLVAKAAELATKEKLRPLEDGAPLGASAEELATTASAVEATAKVLAELPANATAEEKLQKMAEMKELTAKLSSPKPASAPPAPYTAPKLKIDHRSSTIAVTDVPEFARTEQFLRDHFAQFGEVSSVILDPKNNAHCLVKFGDRTVADKAILYGTFLANPKDGTKAVLKIFIIENKPQKQADPSTKTEAHIKDMN